jgi:ribosomal protein S6
MHPPPPTQAELQRQEMLQRIHPINPSVLRQKRIDEERARYLQSLKKKHKKSKKPVNDETCQCY